MTTQRTWTLAVLMYAGGAFLLAYFNGALVPALPGVALVVGSCVLITAEFWKSWGRKHV